MKLVFKQDKQQAHKFNIPISILCSEELVQSILGRIKLQVT